jgi:hypothetical protein
MSRASSDTSFADFFSYFLSHLASLTLSSSPLPCYDRLHSLQCTHRHMLRSDSSTHTLQSSTFPCTTLRSEFFKRVILCFLSCEVCHALSCHSLDGTHRQLLCSAWLVHRYTTSMVSSASLIYISLLTAHTPNCSALLG